MPYPIKVTDVHPGDTLLLGPGPRRARVLEAGPDPEDPACHRIVYHWETVRYAGAILGNPQRLSYYSAYGQIVALASDSRTPPKPLVKVRVALLALVFYVGGAAYFVFNIVTGRADHPVLVVASVFATVISVLLALTAAYQLVRTLRTQKGTTP